MSLSEARELIDDREDDEPLVDEGGNVRGAGCTTAVVGGGRIWTDRCRRRGRVALGPHDHSRFRRYPGTRPYLPHVVGGWPLPNYPGSPKVYYSYKI